METSKTDRDGGAANSTLEKQSNFELRQQSVEVCRLYAGDMHQILRDLMFKTHVSPAPLQNLARRILLDVGEDALATLLPDADGALKNCTSSSEWRSEPVVYAMGIQTASLLAYAAPKMFGWSDRTELLVIAALLQDVGLLLLERQYDLPANQLAIDEPAAYRQHPALSAALAGALTNYAVDLPRLIAQHHERCDGIGYPAGEKADRLAAPSRLLSIAVRFVELVNDVAIRGIAGEDQSESRNIAAAQLLRESAQGELDSRLTESLLQQLAIPIPDSRSLGRHFQVSGLVGKRFRHDEAGTASGNAAAAGHEVNDSIIKGPHLRQQVTGRRSSSLPPKARKKR